MRPEDTAEPVDLPEQKPVYKEKGRSKTLTNQRKSLFNFH